MKRMLALWCLLISAICIVSIISPPLSPSENVWTMNAIILLSLLLCIELGLVYYKSRSRDLDIIIKQSRMNQGYQHQDNHYIDHHSEDN